MKPKILVGTRTIHVDSERLNKWSFVWWSQFVSKWITKFNTFWICCPSNPVIYWLICCFRCRDSIAFVDLGLLYEISGSHSDTSHSVGLLWTSYRPVAVASIWQLSTLTTDIHDPGGIRNCNSSNRAAADLRLRRHGHWDYLYILILIYLSIAVELTPGGSTHLHINNS
jgi:hypothetical protein